MDESPIDELTPIATYMAREMNNNPRSGFGQELRRMNRRDSEHRCLADYATSPWWRQALGTQPRDCARLGLNDLYMALMAWKSKVGTGKDWDHKPKIVDRAEFWSRSTGSAEWHVYGRTAYSHDCWSNIHYGYVGIAVGFDASTLLDGAGIAQFKSDLDAGKWPKGTGPWILPRRYDPPEDRIAITLGIELHRRVPMNITAPALVNAVISTPGLLTMSAAAVREEVKLGIGAPRRSG